MVFWDWFCGLVILVFFLIIWSFGEVYVFLLVGEFLNWFSFGY